MTHDTDATDVRSWRILGVREGMALLARVPLHEAPTAHQAVIVPIDNSVPCECVVAADALATGAWHQPSPLLYMRLPALALRAARALPRRALAGEGRVLGTDSDAAFAPETARIPLDQFSVHRERLRERGMSDNEIAIVFPKETRNE